MIETAQNVLGGVLEPCSISPLTGFYRNGCCDTGPEDRGMHTVCVIVDAEFLAFSKYLGNDLTTPRPEYDFPGLVPGDRWCLCAARFLQAAGEFAAPKVVLAATHWKARDIIPIELLLAHASDPPGTASRPDDQSS